MTNCPYTKVSPISHRRICLNPKIPFKFCAVGDCPLGLGSGTPLYHSCDPNSSPHYEPPPYDDFPHTDPATFHNRLNSFVSETQLSLF